jgi:hypothetical protein
VTIWIEPGFRRCSIRLRAMIEDDDEDEDENDGRESPSV